MFYILLSVSEFQKACPLQEDPSQEQDMTVTPSYLPLLDLPKSSPWQMFQPTEVTAE